MTPIIAIVLVILLGLILFLIIRSRRQANASDVLPPPELSDPVDYTSLPYEEPTTWSDRFRRSSPATKVLLFLLPLALIVILAVIYFSFFQSGANTANATPEPSSPAITDVSAIVTNAERIQVEAKTNLPNGTTVIGTMLENGKDFPWYNPDTSMGKVFDGRISLQLNKAAKAPVPQQGREYSVILSATANDQKVSSTPARLEIPALTQAGFFQRTVAATSVEPTKAPTSAPQPTNPPPTATPVPATPTPKPKPTTTFTTTVFNGGNIRQEPNLQGTVLGQLNAGEVVTLIERTSNGSWYRVDAPAAEGWVSVTLLNAISPTVARQIPVQGQNAQPSAQATTAPTGLTASVYNGGNVRAAPNLQGKVLDQINAYETVTLLQKTKDGAWYKIIDKRNVQGWVSVTLLTIDANVVRRVPVTP